MQLTLSSSKKICSLIHLSSSTILVTRSLPRSFQIISRRRGSRFNNKSCVNKPICNLLNQFTAGKKISMLFAGLGPVRIVKNCDLGLENATLGLRPRAAFSRPRLQFFTIRTSQPANNIHM